MTASFFQFLPLFFWGAFALGAIYSTLESDFRPLAVLAAAAIRAGRLMTSRWKITVALLAVFAAAPLAEAMAALVLNLRGQPLLLAGMVWQAMTAAALAGIATRIHAFALPLPERTSAEQRRYRLESIATGVAIFLIMVALSVGSSFALQSHGVRFHADFIARVLRTLVFVPLALMRPALSLGLRTPVRAAIAAATKPPFIVGIWVIALGLPALGFEWLGADIIHAHPSFASALAVETAKVAFSAINSAWFETTTLLLLARQIGKSVLPDES